MSLQRLRRILQARFTVWINSSEDVVQRVQRQSEKRRDSFLARNKVPPPAKDPAAVSSLQQTPSLDVRAIDLLRKIGDLTTPPWANMASLSASWATRRYFWAIADGMAVRRHFRLSPEVAELDFHQKTLLSDEFGIGMAGLIVENLFNADAAIDVSAALRDPQLYQDVRRRGMTQPDYLMWNVMPRSPYYVVECKGCQTRMAESLNQLRRGLEQVPSLVFGAGDRQVQTLVIATLMRASGTTVYALDPPPGDQRPGQGHPHQDEPPSKRIDKRTWRINNSAEFDRWAWDARRAQLLNWAGQLRSASQILKELLSTRGQRDAAVEDQPLDSWRIGDLFYRGRRIALFPELGIRDLRVFIGVEQELLEAIRGEGLRSEEVAAELHRHIAGRSSEQTVEADAAVSVSSNGTCLVIEGT